MHDYNSFAAIFGALLLVMRLGGRLIHYLDTGTRTPLNYIDVLALFAFTGGIGGIFHG